MPPTPGWITLIYNLPKRNEWIAWTHEGVERRIRKEGLYILYDVRWATEEVFYYGAGSRWDAVRFCSYGPEDSTFFGRIFIQTTFTPEGWARWSRKNVRRIKKRLFYNTVRPRIYGLKAITGGKEETHESLFRDGTLRLRSSG